MKYSVIHLSMSFTEEWQEDVLTQGLFDLGCDTLDGQDAYIQTELWQQNQDEITQLCSTTDGVRILSVEDCPDEDWNATWEQEHPMENLPLGVQIIPHCAFGAGYHETTHMLIEELMKTSLTNKNILDNGCGTGVLGIFAAKMNAASVTAIDIDENSVNNTIENATLNNITLDAQLGDLAELMHTSPSICGHHYHLILSNIHRNILLRQMAIYAQLLQPKGEVWLSGFYESDCAILVDEARQYGLRQTAVIPNGEWRMIKLIKD